MAVRIITGCSSGFGQAIAAAFAARGDVVVATFRQIPGETGWIDSTATIDMEILDVTDQRSRNALVDRVMNRHGRIDTLVNNAGIFASASVEDTPESQHRQIFETNYFGPAALMQAVLPLMRAQGGGRIVNITAIGAILSTPLMGAYCASKHALDALGAAVDLEGRPFNIRAPSVLPGQFRTAIADNAPPPILTDPYRGIAQALGRSRQERAKDVLTDLSPVVDAVVAAATQADPKSRYLAGIGIALELQQSLAELERLQSFDAARAGLPETGATHA